MSMNPTLQLNDQRHLPQIGLGVWKISNEEAVPAIHAALEAGYRSIDTAAIYRNEEGVGEAIRTAGIRREELFITTKLWNDCQGYEKALKAFDQSLKRLKLDYVDLYLIHWPVPQQDSYMEAWRALMKLKEEGLARSIGVSNFGIPQLERVMAETGWVPVVNQIELHPLFPQQELRAFHAKHGIATESWSPLGRGALLANEIVSDIARKHGKSPAQVVLRWHVELGLVVIPKSVTPARIRENIAVFDFKLDDEDLARIASLDTGRRLGPDPATFA